MWTTAQTLSDFPHRQLPSLTEPASVGCGARAPQLPGVLSSFSENNVLSLEVTAHSVMGAQEPTLAMARNNEHESGKGWFSGISPLHQIKDLHMSLFFLRYPFISLSR